MNSSNMIKIIDNCIDELHELRNDIFNDSANIKPIHGNTYSAYNKIICSKTRIKETRKYIQRKLTKIEGDNYRSQINQERVTKIQNMPRSKK